MGKKLIFLDVDGTLTDYDNHIPASAAAAIRKARANGHRVYLCTGRSKAEIYDEIWAIGLDGMIGGNGCYAEEHGRVLFHQTLSRAVPRCRGLAETKRTCVLSGMQQRAVCQSGFQEERRSASISSARGWRRARAWRRPFQG